MSYDFEDFKKLIEQKKLKTFVLLIEGENGEYFGLSKGHNQSLVYMLEMNKQKMLNENMDYKINYTVSKDSK